MGSLDKYMNTMEYTKRMVALMGALRREMHGEVSTSMGYYGKKYGLNYGVSLPTIRAIARGEQRDYGFAQHLLIQDVRELKLAAFSIADPALLSEVDIQFWADAIINSEVATEAAQSLFAHADREIVESIYRRWSQSDSALIVYAMLMSLFRNGAAAQIVDCGVIVDIVARYPDQKLVGDGVVNLLVSILESDRGLVDRILVDMGSSTTSEYIREEMSWRLNV